MPKKATGQTRENADGTTSVRVRVGPGPNDRVWFKLPPSGAEERSKLLAALALTMRPVAGPAQVEAHLQFVADARTPRGLESAVGACEDIASGVVKASNGAAVPTFADFALEWTSGKLQKKYPHHVRAKKDSSEDVQIFRDYANPEIGPVRLTDITLAHAMRVMGRVPADLAPRTRRHAAQALRKLLSLAVYPGCYIESNPIPREWMPQVPKNANKAKTCLRPSEDALLMACSAVPIERRIAYGVLAREGMRASELSALRFSDLDLAIGRIKLDTNKTDDPRAWALSPDVVRVLAWWKKRLDAADGDHVLGGLDLTQGPRWLRGKKWDPKTGHKDELGDLKTAGVDRAELFERSKSRQPIRLHDLRATFVTVSLANGKTEQWVSDRTGHRSSQMISTYSRQAREWGELDLGTFEPLDELLPEVPRQGGGGPSNGSKVPNGTAEKRGAPEAAASPASAARRPPAARGVLGREWAASSSDCRTRTCDPAVNRRYPESESYEGSGKRLDRDPRIAPDPTAKYATAHSRPNRLASIEAAIARLTDALGTAADDVISDLVAERRALREELAALRNKEKIVNLAPRRK